MDKDKKDGTLPKNITAMVIVTIIAGVIMAVLVLYGLHNPPESQEMAPGYHDQKNVWVASNTFEIPFNDKSTAFHPRTPAIEIPQGKTVGVIETPNGTFDINQL